ncbi:MAG: hypothetical protein PVS2B2_28340 [Candidatus Acidiferrum sp.]
MTEIVYDILTKHTDSHFGRRVKDNIRLERRSGAYCLGCG